MSRVLIVDDEPDIVDLLSFHLSENGYEVASAFSGARALKAATDDPPDGIVLDLMIPDLDGISVCEFLHRNSATSHIPIIILTGCAAEGTRDVALRYGASDYLTKPFRPKEVVERVKKLVPTPPKWAAAS